MIHNSITLVGHLGQDAVINSANGKTVINFSLAVSDDKKQADGSWKPETIWFDIALWSDRDASNLKKGALVMLVGTPRPHQYQKKDGTTGYGIRVTADNVRVLVKAQVQSGEVHQPNAATPAPPNYAQAAQDIADSLPF